MVLNSNVGRMPKYIVVVLDDDIITFLNYKKSGVAQFLADWLQWLMEAFESLISDFLAKLLIWAKKDSSPCLYWCNAPSHSGFSTERNEIRKKFNNCLEILCKGRVNMRLIRFKDHWDFYDKSIAHNDKITEAGIGQVLEMLSMLHSDSTQEDMIFTLQRPRCMVM